MIIFSNLIFLQNTWVSYLHFTTYGTDFIYYGILFCHMFNKCTEFFLCIEILRCFSAKSDVVEHTASCVSLT